MKTPANLHLFQPSASLHPQPPPWQGGGVYGHTSQHARLLQKPTPTLPKMLSTLSGLWHLVKKLHGRRAPNGVYKNIILFLFNIINFLETMYIFFIYTWWSPCALLSLKFMKNHQNQVTSGRFMKTIWSLKKSLLLHFILKFVLSCPKTHSKGMMVISCLKTEGSKWKRYKLSSYN